jgi:hypothetical protein
MDGQQFDRISRVLATGTGRRSVLRGIVAGAVGGFLRGRPAAAQEYDNRGQRCPSGSSLECNSPCRLCDTSTRRCVYACTQFGPNYVCSASGSCPTQGLNKGCCVPQQPTP